MKFVTALISSVVLVVLIVIPMALYADDLEPLNLTKKDIINLNQPGVVRIVSEMKGDFVIEPFKLDFDNIIIVDDKINSEGEINEPVRDTFDEKFFGTGFIVSSDGHILTNAHVVSEETIKAQIAMDAIFLVVFSQALAEEMTEEEATEFERRLGELTDEEGIAFTRSVFDYINLDNIEIKITVLNPSTNASRLEDFLTEGYEAKVVIFDEDFTFNERDVAVLDIEADNLPALLLGKTADVEVGDEVSTFGFPSSADFSRENLLEPTFTDGTVNSLKRVTSQSFSVIQTDAKISEGSSGSPLFDDEGNVIAIVTAQTADQGLGDNFAFGIPIEVAQSLMDDKFITNVEGDYQKDLKEGILLYQNRRCEEAISAIESAIEKTNDDFLMTDQVSSYIKECESIIEDGKSIDSKWDEISDKIIGVGGLRWTVILGAGLGILALVGIMFVLIRRIKKGRKRVDALEDMLVHQKVAESVAAEKAEPQAADAGALKGEPGTGVSATSKPTGPLPEDLVDFIVKMRNKGVEDETIKIQLKNAGWEDETITKALGV